MQNISYCEASYAYPIVGKLLLTFQIFMEAMGLIGGFLVVIWFTKLRSFNLNTKMLLIHDCLACMISALFKSWRTLSGIGDYIACDHMLRSKSLLMCQVMTSVDNSMFLGKKLDFCNEGYLNFSGNLKSASNVN